MTSCETMIENENLLSIENEINLQIDSIKNHSDRLKVAVFLCLLSESSIRALKDVDTQGFVNALNERMTSIHREYDGDLSTLISQLKEDSVVLSNIENAEANLDNLKREAELAVGKFESELKKVITINDKSIISEL